jgi:hypothetical protein
LLGFGEEVSDEEDFTPFILKRSRKRMKAASSTRCDKGEILMLEEHKQNQVLRR